MDLQSTVHGKGIDVRQIVTKNITNERIRIPSLLTLKDGLDDL